MTTQSRISQHLDAARRDRTHARAYRATERQFPMLGDAMRSAIRDAYERARWHVRLAASVKREATR